MPIGRLLRGLGRVGSIVGIPGAGAVTEIGNVIRARTRARRRNAAAESAGMQAPVGMVAAGPAVPPSPVPAAPAAVVPQQAGIGQAITSGAIAGAVSGALQDAGVPAIPGITQGFAAVPYPNPTSGDQAITNMLSPNSPGGILPTFGEFRNLFRGGSQSTALVPGGGPMNSADIFQLLATTGRGGSKRTVVEYLFRTGMLAQAGLVRPPIIFTSQDGQVKRGSLNGWVLITKRQNGQEVTFQMPRFFARQLGLWKPRRKPLLSAGEVNAVRKANRVRGRVEKLAKDTCGLYVRKSKPCPPSKPKPRGRR